LQHRGLARVAEVLVFDERGVGNGLLLPAGPLREPLPAAPGPRQRVLYAGDALPALRPATRLHRRLGPAWPLAAWWAGQRDACQPLSVLQGRRLVAVAGLGAPEKFFRMLDAAGLTFERLPQPDHAAYKTLPWPAGTAEVVLTEKDAVKLLPERVAGTRVWVLGLDLALPQAYVDDLLRLLPTHAAAASALRASPQTPDPDGP